MPLDVQDCMSWTVKQLEEARPRVVGPRRDTKPVVVFLDGSCEPEGTMVGAVMFHPVVGVQCFGMVVPEQIVDSWKTSMHQTQVIGQAEIFPAVLARWTWAEELADQRLIFFIDNDSARLALIKAYSPVTASLNLIMQGLRWDQTNSATVWYSRVPTFSNIADGPSRFSIPDELRQYNPKIVRPKLDTQFSKSMNVRMEDVRSL